MVIRSMQRANRVKAMRAEKGWTQAALGLKIGVSKETISKIERRVQGITEGQAHALATIFNARIDDLYEAGTEPAPGFAEEAKPFAPHAESFASRIPLEENQSWYRISKSYLDQLGYMDGDEVIIDISREAMSNLHIGDVVVANRYPAKGGKGAETIVRQFIPPSLLITNALRNNLPILNLNSDDVSILGVVVYPRRRGHDPARKT
jgi:putative transcriptional regulator